MFQHFVSERKYDEDLGKAVRFTFELEPLKSSITGFGSGRSSLFTPDLQSHDLVGCGLLVASLPVYHPRTGYSNRSRCSSTSSSVTSPSLQETPPPPRPPQTQNPPSESRPPPNKQVSPQFPSASALGVQAGAPLTSQSSQIFQGNRRTFQGQGYHSGSQRYNGGPHTDRNAARTNHRSQSDGASAGPTSHNNSRGPPRSSTYHQDRPAQNGLPQRPPRTHCP